ncbi:hypothetical protein J4457_03500 [Candidatus Woesearchaeota archaeon]|nr:hypothetical protein [Candidatus Woesearchaeota archaeon]
MDLHAQEKEYLRALLKREIKRFEEEGETVLEGMPAPFAAAEQRYDDFLKGLLKKIK